jgi:probable F420-dependent oxidoreductase
VSIWGGGLWLAPERRSEARDAAAELEDRGYTRLWLSGGQGEGVSSAFADLLDATTDLQVASGIVSIWRATPHQAAEATAALEAAHPGRFLLGIGTSHAAIVEGHGERYERPYSRTVEYLQALDGEQPPVPRERRALAALGPRMLRLAAEATAGAHPYFVPADHTALARETLGSGPLLAPEVAVVLEPDADAARAVARRYMAGYLAMPNYTENLRRLGYGDDDLADGGSDRLVDVLIPWGDTATVAAGIAQHYDAGADEVAVQVLTADADRFPRAECAELAEALIA